MIQYRRNLPQPRCGLQTPTCSTVDLFYFFCNGSFQSLSLLEQKISLRFCLWSRQSVPDNIHMPHSLTRQKISQIFTNVYLNCHYKMVFKEIPICLSQQTHTQTHTTKHTHTDTGTHTHTLTQL